LSPRFGLALDNLLGAEIVLADGRSTAADASENPDLLWALRGGGGNLGVVTSMRIRLHPLRELLAGLILFPWSEAGTVLRGYADTIASAPDELSIMAGVLSGPDGKPVLFLAPAWSGEPVLGERVMAGLKRLGTAMLAQIGSMTCGDMLGMFDAHVANGRHYAIETRWLSELTPDVIAALVAACGNRTSPFTAIALHHFHGAAARVSADATAFRLRNKHFLLEIIAAWEPTSEDEARVHRRWARDLSQTLAPAALPGGYANLLDPNEHDQIKSAFGSNITRLRELKRRFDPDNVFSSAIPLKA
jgi:hypothetical protein